MSMSLTLTPIGTIYTSMRTKFECPHQPLNSSSEEYSVIELLPGHDFEKALRDLSGFDRIWLLWWFHKNSTWRPLVLPPRGSAKKRGLFATRSPHRPNPIGLSAVSLIQISGRRLIVGSTDLLDGTPILDIKPYIAEVDAFPQAKSGWVSEVQGELSGEPRYSVEVAELARVQLSWLKESYNVEFFDRARAILERDPNPHRTRRIAKSKEGHFRMGCGPWRVIYRIEGESVIVERVARGYPERLLLCDDYKEIPDKEAQIAFGERFKDQLSH